MIILSGTLLKIYNTPEGKDKDGKAYGGDTKIQILNETKLRNGEMKNEIIDLTVPTAGTYKEQIGQEIEVPVNIRAYKNTIYFEAV